MTRCELSSAAGRVCSKYLGLSQIPVRRWWAQVEWFERTLQENKGRPTIVFTHAPIMCVLHPWGRLRNAGNLVDL